MKDLSGIRISEMEAIVWEGDQGNIHLGAIKITWFFELSLTSGPSCPGVFPPSLFRWLGLLQTIYFTLDPRSFGLWRTPQTPFLQKALKNDLWRTLQNISRSIAVIILWIIFCHYSGCTYCTWKAMFGQTRSLLGLGFTAHCVRRFRRQPLGNPSGDCWEDKGKYNFF